MLRSQCGQNLNDLAKRERRSEVGHDGVHSVALLIDGQIVCLLKDGDVMLVGVGRISSIQADARRLFAQLVLLKSCYLKCFAEGPKRK